MYPLAYESLTLHNLCDNVWGWHQRTDVAAIAKERELYWLGKLEEFLYNIK